MRITASSTAIGLLTLLINTSCTTTSRPAAATSAFDRDVLAAVLKSSCELRDGKYTLLSSETQPAPSRIPKVPRRYREAVRALAERNESPGKVPIDLECEGVKIKAASELDSIFSGDRFIEDKWGDFFRNFPRAREIMRVTLPGYSADGNSAVVYISGARGSLAGGGGLCLLERKGAEWRLVRTVPLWVS
jgi:hypothetical protein